MFITFFDEIGNSKTFEANLQNSSRRPVESRGRAIEILQGGPPDQMRAIIHSHKCYYFVSNDLCRNSVDIKGLYY